MKKNKIIALGCALTLSLGLIGCGNTATNESSEENVSVSKDESKGKKEEKNEAPINIDDIKLDIKVREPDSIGKVYVEATLTNNSKLPIKYCQVTILNKDVNEKSYLTFTDTIMPGETSAKTDTFGPSTGNIDDVEILKYQMTLVGEDGEDIFLEYDTKLKQYEW